jgi:serine/threonine protein kinase
MSDNSLNQIEDVFHEVLERPVQERVSYLRNSCSGNNILYDEVCSLLAAWEKSQEFLEKPALEFGLRVLSDNNEQSFVGRTIGSYKVVSLLGRGGMGAVYLAIDKRLDRKVALKFLSPEVTGDKSAKDQLITEARASAALEHPNICQIYGIEVHKKNHFIVMQYIEGITLAELMRKGPLPKEQLMKFAKQIVGALAEAHAHGIIHRDIKPQNIMVTHRGQAKILDFGLAASVLAENQSGLHSLLKPSLKQGAVPGTVRYMSPEQLRGDDLDYRSDVFSLGTLLYEMESGSNPFSPNRDFRNN